ncbi:hypothetical protein SeLEV6574_g00131 [Synchytrium endobioticum]|uniref:Uncharacterized protein n=1 Tax=Synchytrium endobioticum TaxID=286115 RepID=A0A507DJL0_9FUNG|nr:hypothetical protein SeLEV6574_g00131 [Synchytrium endobioticum]
MWYALFECVFLNEYGISSHWCLDKAMPVYVLGVPTYPSRLSLSRPCGVNFKLNIKSHTINIKMRRFIRTSTPASRSAVDTPTTISTSAPTSSAASATVTAATTTEPSAIIISVPSPSLPSVTPVTPLGESMSAPLQSTTIPRESGADLSDITGLMQQGLHEQLPGTAPIVRFTTSDTGTAGGEESAAAPSAEALIESERRLVSEARAKIDELEAQIAENIKSQSQIVFDWESRYHALEIEYQEQARAAETEKNRIKASMSEDLEAKLSELHEKYQRDVRALQGDVVKAVNDRDRILKDKNDVVAQVVQLETLENVLKSTQTDLEKMRQEGVGKDMTIQELRHHLVEVERQHEENIANTRKNWREDVLALREDFRIYKSQYTKIEAERDAFLAKVTELQLQRDGERQQWQSDVQSQLLSMDQVKTKDKALTQSMQHVRLARDHAVQVAETTKELLSQVSEDGHVFHTTLSKVSGMLPVMYKELFNKARLMNIVDQAHTDLNTSLVRFEEIKAHRDKVLRELESLNGISSLKSAEAAVPSAVEKEKGNVEAAASAVTSVTVTGPVSVQVKKMAEKIQKLEDVVVNLQNEIVKLDRQTVNATHAASEANGHAARLYKELEEATRDRQRLREKLRSTQHDLGETNTALNTVLNQMATPQLFQRVTQEIECLQSDISRLEEVYVNISCLLRSGTVPSPPPPTSQEATEGQDVTAVVAGGSQRRGIEEGAIRPRIIAPHGIRFRDTGIQSPLPSIISRQYQVQQPRPSRERMRIFGTKILGRPISPRA